MSTVPCWHSCTGASWGAITECLWGFHWLSLMWSILGPLANKTANNIILKVQFCSGQKYIPVLFCFFFFLSQEDEHLIYSLPPGIIKYRAGTSATEKMPYICFFSCTLWFLHCLPFPIHAVEQFKKNTTTNQTNQSKTTQKQNNNKAKTMDHTMVYFE